MSKSSNLTHINADGYAKMVTVTDKNDTERVAKASGFISMQPNTIEAIRAGKMKKGDVIGVAQVAGIMGAKRTSDLIPMCHPLMLTGVDLHFEIKPKGVAIEAVVKTVGKTGVEMEALQAVSTAALTLYDMCKAIDKEMVISDIKLLEKIGGKSGHYRRQEMGEVVGTVKAINISEKKGVIKTPIPEGFFKEDHGLEGDAHAGKWHRQVSLLAQESIDKMTETGILGLCSGKFAENITTEGLILHTLPVGTKLSIGETIQEVSQIGKECHSGCAIKVEVGQCIMPKEGIFTRVLKSGTIKVGDAITIIEE